MIHDMAHALVLLINGIGVLITLWGIVLSFSMFLRKEFTSAGADRAKNNNACRARLGSYLVLALEFFIAGDIIKTIVTPSWDSLALLGAVVLIRTILAYFLAQDLKKNEE